MEINKDLLIKDFKEFNSIDKLFLFFTSGQVDMEYGEEAKLCYKELKWDQSQSYDVINSFWTTFSYVMRLKYPKLYPIAKAGNVKIYKSHRTYYDKEYASFPEKYFKEKSKERKQVTDLCQEYPAVNKLADLCHTVANFMPCPQMFNSVKGVLSDVKDYFPLMIDKIQECVNKKSDLEYYISRTPKVVSNQIVKEWHSFFIKNQEKYCLSMYYEVKDNVIKGIPFFEGQSLSYPCPIKKEEVEECLETMVKKIGDRADLILKKYNEELKSNK